MASAIVYSLALCCSGSSPSAMSNCCARGKVRSGSPACRPPLELQLPDSEHTRAGGAWCPTWAWLGLEAVPSKPPYVKPGWAAAIILAYLCSRHLHQRLAVHTLLCALGICQILVFVMLHCSKPLYFSLKTNVCTSAAMSAVGISCRDQGKIPKIPKIRTWISIKTHLLLVESHSHYLYIWVGWWAIEFTNHYNMQLFK